MKRKVLNYIILVIIIAWLLVLSFDKPQTQPNKVIEEVTVEGFSTDLTKTIAEHKKETVTVMSEGGIQSGFVYKQYNDKAYIISCYHGISNASVIEVLFGETYKTEAVIVGYDFNTDIAVLVVNTPYELDTIDFGDASLLQPGEFVLSVGSPTSAEYAGSFELGIVSLSHMMLDNTITYKDTLYSYYLDMICFSSNIKAGYSGSPLYNMDGQVVGISTMSNGNNRYAITSNEAKIIADTIIELDELRRNDLGISVSYIGNLYTYEKANLGMNIDSVSGLYVKDVKEGSIMDKADIRKGDIILKINDIELTDFDSYLSVLYFKTNEFNISYMRDGVNYTITAGINHD